MPRRDFKYILIIGAAVGILIQPILTNTVGDRVSGLGIRVLIFLFFLVLAPLALWIASLISRLWRGIYQFAQFAAVGTLNTFIDVGVLNLETFLYGSSLISNTLFAFFKAISFLCATTNSFLWNKYWTFGSTEKTEAKQVTSFYVIAAIGWGLNVGAATLVKALGGGGDISHVRLWVNLVAPLAGVAASFLWDFFGYKYFVFKKK
jgi:putative flippase GtrA